MEKQKNILGAIIILVLICAVGYSYYTFHKPVKVTEIKDSPFSVLLQNSTSTFSETESWYEAKIIYPTNNQTVSGLIFKMWEDFAKETTIKDYTTEASATEALGINVPGLKYTFIAQYKLATSTNTISYVYEVYTFTGGAHGGTQVYAITENEKQEIIPIETILPESSLPKIAKLAEASIREQKKERMKSYGNMSDKEIDEALKEDSFIAEGVKPTRDNYSVAWYDGNDVVISFGQYQVGAYAEGMFEVRIPKTEI